MNIPFKYFSLIALILSACLPARAATYIVALASDIDETYANNAIQISYQMLELTPVDDTIKFVSATGRPRLIASLEKAEYKNRLIKKRALAPVQNSIKRFLVNSVRDGKGSTGYNINTLRLLRNLGSFTESDEETTILVVGKPIWTSGESQYSFIDESATSLETRYRRPSHACLIADKFKSPFSIQDIPSYNNTSVVWWDVSREEYDGLDVYFESLENYLALMLDQVGISLSPIETIRGNVIEMVFDEGRKTISPESIASEKEVRMLTLADLRNGRGEFDLSLPPEKRRLSSLFICDASGSNSGALAKMSERLRQQVKSPKLNYGLILINGGNPASAYIHSISDDPGVMANDFLAASGGGIDQVSALYSALKVARDKLRAVNSSSTKIIVMADVAPVDLPNTPKEHTYSAMVDDLLVEGHQLVFIRTAGRHQDTKWIKKGTFEVKDL